MDESIDNWLKEQLRFIEVELDTAIMFMELACTEFDTRGDSPRLRELVWNAQRAQRSALQFLGSVTAADAVEKQRLFKKALTFKAALEQLEDRRHPPAEKQNEP